jgi:hypothetical protein
MEEPRNDVILDELTTPDGPFELFAYRPKRTVWIGARPKGSNSPEAFGLHTGSRQPYVEASMALFDTWGIAYGAVGPEVRRVEVRSSLGRTFPARIVPLPDGFEEEYRAAWGVAVECEDECELIGYDARGRIINQHMFRPHGWQDASPEETIELIRAHCENQLRYYCWALERMPSIPEQADQVEQVRGLLSPLAQVLAFIDGASDDIAATTVRDEIIRRVADQVSTEAWEPPFARPDDGSDSG